MARDTGLPNAKVALVTGASRGIGKAIAVELADAGYDVAILARTVHEGETREHSSTLKRSDTSPLPGSLDSTSELIRAAGRRCLAVPADLLDHESNALAPVVLIKEVLPQMIARGDGTSSTSRRASRSRTRPSRPAPAAGD